MRKCTVVFALLAVALLSVASAGAQNGTINLLSPRVWTDKHPGWMIEGRAFGGDGNNAWATGVRLGLAKDQELQVLFTSLDTTNALIGGSSRDSNWDAVALTWKWEQKPVWNGVDWAVIPELNVNARGPEGRVTGSLNVAQGPTVIPALAIAAERQYGRWSLMLEPKVGFFGDDWSNSEGGSTPAFGTVATIGAGARYPGLGGYFAGDLSACVAGSNAVSNHTGLLKKTPLWSLSWTEILLMHGSPTLTVFGTNTVGPSVATSMIGTPGAEFAEGTGGGARITGYF